MQLKKQVKYIEVWIESIMKFIMPIVMLKETRCLQTFEMVSCTLSRLYQLTLNHPAWILWFNFWKSSFCNYKFLFDVYLVILLAPKWIDIFGKFDIKYFISLIVEFFPLCFKVEHMLLYSKKVWESKFLKACPQFRYTRLLILHKQAIHKTSLETPEWYLDTGQSSIFNIRFYMYSKLSKKKRNKEKCLFIWQDV
jgi:hypothetical protein